MERRDRLQTNLNTVMEHISSAALRSGRNPQSIHLVTVGKTQSVQAIDAAISAGARIIGENYIQEARQKIESLGHRDVQWHYIGHLQSNKAKYAVRLFDLIHSVDSVKLMAALDHRAGKIDKIQNILLQVNNSGEASKSGVDESAAEEVALHIAQFPNLRLQGLMTMPPFFNAPEKVRPYFTRLRNLRDQLCKLLNQELPHLSMGMSGDFEVAVQEGATLVRVGTAIFGERL